MGVFEFRRAGKRMHSVALQFLLIKEQGLGMQEDVLRRCWSLQRSSDAPRDPPGQSYPF